MGERAPAAEYDDNGNMASRVTQDGAQVLTWDAENRLIGYQSSTSSASYASDGDGRRVRTVITDTGGVTTTVYIGNYYEWVDGSNARTYYDHNGLRVAMREGGHLTYLLGDHLGSTSVSYRADGQQTVTQKYLPWGDIRPGPENALPTDYTFAGQRLDAGSQLIQMGARWYDSLTGRWVSADTVVPEPGNPQDLNRFSYCRNSPLAFSDTSGHFPGEPPPPSNRVAWEAWMRNVGLPWLNTVYNEREWWKYGLTFESAARAFMAGQAEAHGQSMAYGIIAQHIAAEAQVPIEEVRRFVEVQILGDLHGVDYLGVGVAQAEAERLSKLAGVFHAIVVAGVHGNSLENMAPHHVYEIYDTETGKCMKTGISGQPLNPDGTSPRASAQVNAANRAAGRERYVALVVAQDIPGRPAALAAEQANTNRLHAMGLRLPWQIRPGPQ